ncbi:hypothetical protein BGW80DRAFT_1443108 [Lactifluus volemus]|nr:hypothetical protein BGW80DRAFT_1443108 [Lactifluus volemus]
MTTRAPAQTSVLQVDYFTHNWREDDLLRSCRYVKREKLTNTTVDGIRLENASWRSWPWLAWTDNLKEAVKNDTVNWLGHPDALYGPLYAAIDWEAPSHRQQDQRGLKSRPVKLFPHRQPQPQPSKATAREPIAVGRLVTPKPCHWTPHGCLPGERESSYIDSYEYDESDIFDQATCAFDGLQLEPTPFAPPDFDGDEDDSMMMASSHDEIKSLAIPSPTSKENSLHPEKGPTLYITANEALSPLLMP